MAGFINSVLNMSKALVAFNQEKQEGPISGLLHDYEYFVDLRFQLYCPGIIDTHISGGWTQRGQGRVQQQCRPRQFSDTGDCPRTLDAHLNQHFG